MKMLEQSIQNARNQDSIHNTMYSLDSTIIVLNMYICISISTYMKQRLDSNIYIYIYM